MGHSEKWFDRILIKTRHNYYLVWSMNPLVYSSGERGGGGGGGGGLWEAYCTVRATTMESVASDFAVLTATPSSLIASQTETTVTRCILSALAAYQRRILNLSAWREQLGGNGLYLF